MAQRPHKRPSRPSRFSGPLPPLPLQATLWLAVAARLRLSPQLTRAIELLTRGLCNKQIADVMGISESTLNTYFDRIGNDIDVRGRTAILCHVMRISHEIRDKWPLS